MDRARALAAHPASAGCVFSASQNVENARFTDEAAMNLKRTSVVLIVASLLGLACGCRKTEPQYSTERKLSLAGTKKNQVWAIAPAINLSGQASVDPLLQADLLYQQIQDVRGLTVVPVNRVAEVYSTLRIDKVQSEEQAAIVCDLLGADAIVVPTITIFDPYNPPKLGASLQLLHGKHRLEDTGNVDPRDLARRAAPPPDAAMPQPASFRQSVGMFDAANGSVREALFDYARGRNDPVGPMGRNEYLHSMDRYCGFVYHQLVEELIRPAAAR
jgi:hypothetical protein